MSFTLKCLRALSDPTRLRIVSLLDKDELSVNELQEITRMGQSRISTHLGLLQDSGLVQSRREGKRTFYRLSPPANAAAGEFGQLAIRGAAELPEHAGDQVNLKRILARRREPPRPEAITTSQALALSHPPIADCARYDLLRGSRAAA